MENIRIGYCCINLSLADKKVTANRGMVKKTFEQKGPTYAGELAYLNLCDLLTILKWNVENDIYVYRMSSDIFPWMSEYEITELANFDQIQEKLTEIGKFILGNGIRVSMHPGQFDVLCSPNPSVVEKTIIDLDKHSQIMDLMGLPSSYIFPINIHLGGTYGDKESAAARFCENFQLLQTSTKSRLVVENDDKASQFSVNDLYSMVYMKIGTPITFDFHHHRFCDGGLAEETALRLASTTWKGYRPLTHYSSCKRTFEDPTVIARSHADFIYETIKSYNLRFDIEIEAKAKDLAVLKYREDFVNESLLENYLPFDQMKKVS